MDLRIAASKYCVLRTQQARQHATIMDQSGYGLYCLTHVFNASRVMLRDVKFADCPILALPQSSRA